MEGLLIDYDNVIETSKFEALKSYVSPSPDTKYNTGIVLIIPKKILRKLETCDDKINYANSKEFIHSIKHYSYLVFNEKNCDIINPKTFIRVILKTLQSKFPYYMTLYVKARKGEELRECLKVGFRDPKFCNTSLLGTEYKFNGICLSRKNDLEKYDATFEVEYILDQRKNKRCKIKATFDKETMDYLKLLSHHGNTMNRDKTFTQKEVGGKFTINTTTKNFVHRLSIDKDSIIYGEEEGVVMLDGLYTFHTHPMEAYKKHSVKHAWPSCQDYFGYLSCVKLYGTILHAIISIEGVYVITLSDYWGSNIDKLRNVRDFINNNFELPRNQLTPEEYVSKINSIKYGKYPVFIVRYLDWNSYEKIMLIMYDKSDGNCIYR